MRPKSGCDRSEKAASVAKTQRSTNRCPQSVRAGDEAQVLGKGVGQPQQHEVPQTTAVLRHDRDDRIRREDERRQADHGGKRLPLDVSNQSPGHEERDRHEERRKVDQEIRAKPVPDADDCAVQRGQRQRGTRAYCARRDHSEDQQTGERKRRLRIVTQVRKLHQVNRPDSEAERTGKGEEATHAQSENSEHQRHRSAEEYPGERPERAPGNRARPPRRRHRQHQVSPRRLKRREPGIDDRRNLAALELRTPARQKISHRRDRRLRDNETTSAGGHHRRLEVFLIEVAFETGSA